MSSLTGTLVISLPIADRWRAMVFNREAFGLEPMGEPAEDGVPEPLQFQINDQALLMLVPTGGFGWVLGDDREVAPSGSNECLLSMAVTTQSDVADVIERAPGTPGERSSPSPSGTRGVTRGSAATLTAISGRSSSNRRPLPERDRLWTRPRHSSSGATTTPT
ncbi:VOC family protein [Nocardiopsis sp. NRRL B-16309]|uniref:VOC family protein n=1 Tax=Nocardiopsis sp. NRRL B-16309 TaxID=1519494 RepID=UPI000ADE792E|nr:VOC family protein [Nocardiopsis sp. NRRL B-16309]